MALRVDYAPVGALGSLAAAAGRGAGAQASLQGSVQMAELAMRQLAQDRAFRLQKAQGERILAAQMRSPAADAVIDRAGVVRQERSMWQAQATKQLEKLRSAKHIDEAQYQRALLAVVTSNETLLAQALAAPKAIKPAVSSTQEIDLIRRPYQEKRRILADELRAAHKAASDPLADPATTAARAKQLEKEMDELFEAEQRDLSQWRESGGVAEEAAPAAPGTMTMTRAFSAPEKGIVQMAREMAGPAASKVGGDKPVTTYAGPTAPPAPVQPSQRVAGQVYLLPNGQHGIWRGTGWEVIG